MATWPSLSPEAEVVEPLAIAVTKAVGGRPGPFCRGEADAAHGGVEGVAEGLGTEGLAVLGQERHGIWSAIGRTWRRYIRHSFRNSRPAARSIQNTWKALRSR